ncbi:MAG: ParB/RepB/Spo0J family partition protein [Clostridia bacterium]
MPVFDFFNKQNKQSDKDLTDAPVRYIEVDINQVLKNPNQPRKLFDDLALSELAQSIEQVGLIQPLLVRKLDESNYELIAGERRLRALKLLGRSTVACIVQNDILDETSAMMALIENLQRENLNYMEEAQCYAGLIESYSLTQDELATRLGKSQSSVANKLRLLKLPSKVKEAIRNTDITERHARALLRLKDEKTQLDVLNKITEKNLSVKESETLVEKTLNKLFDEKQAGAKPRPAIIRLVKDYRLFMNSVNAAINALRDTGITVETEQVDRDDGVDIHIKVTNNQ